MVKVGRTDDGQLDGPEPHRPPHRLRRDHRRGVPPVRRHPGRRPRRAPRGLRRLRPHLRSAIPPPNGGAESARRPGGADPRGREEGGAGRLRATRSPAAPAPTWPTWSRRPVCASRHSDEGDAAGRCTTGSSRAYLRVSNPVDSRRAARRRRARPQDPRRDRRRPEGRHHRRADHRRGRHVQRPVHPRPHRRGRRRPTSRSSWSGVRLRAQTTRTTSASSTAGCRSSAPSATASTAVPRLRRLLALRTHRYRSPFDDAPVAPLAGGEARPGKILERGRTGRGALRARVEAAARGVRHPAEPRRAVRVGGRGREGRRPHRLPGGDEGVLARPAAQERARSGEGRRRRGEGRARRVRRADDEATRKASAPAGRAAGRKASRACSCARWSAAASRSWSASRRTRCSGRS